MLVQFVYNHQLSIINHIIQARDHCDAFGLNDFESWYRIGVFNKKMPDHCVAPNKCGGDNGYYVGGNLGHPTPGS